MKKTMAHLCVLDRNVGDNALNLAIDNMFKRKYDIDYFPVLGKVYTQSDVDELNQYDVVLLGGGGLIHSYKPNMSAWNHTGTMWEIPLDLLKKIESKIVLYSVGYNGFYGEPKASNKMEQFFDILVEKDAVISFRNDGSLERFLKDFPKYKNETNELKNQFIDVPDAGFFFKAKGRKKKDDNFIAINIASDRPKLRYENKKHKGGVKELLDFIINKVKDLSERKVLIPHTPDDEKLYKTFDLPEDWTVYEFKRSVDDTNEIIKLYKDAVFSISTRGHSQICSIGNGTPTFAISTHPKVVGFMKDYNFLQFCYNYQICSHKVGNKKFEDFLTNLKEYKSNINKFNKSAKEYINLFNKEIL